MNLLEARAAVGLRTRAYRLLAHRSTVGQRVFSWLSMGTIGLCVFVTMVSTMPSVGLSTHRLLERLEVVFGVAFAIEYAVRVWTAIETKRYREGAFRRIRYALSPMALLDIVAVAALLLPPLYPVVSLSRPQRLVRFLRLLAVLRFARYSPAMRTLGVVFRKRSAELGAFLFVVGVLLTVSAGMMHAVEGDVQPTRFGSIPDALWWSVTTLTTIGYGDSLPFTPLGRVVGGFIAIVGIGLVAIPAGILASGFQEAYRQQQEEALAGRRGGCRCTACGQILPRVPGEEGRSLPSSAESVHERQGNQGRRVGARRGSTKLPRGNSGQARK